MAELKDFLQLKTITGDPIKSGNVIVQPQSQALMLRWPFGGLVWNRPLAVLVERDGQQQRIPIRDVTRILQVGFMALTLLLTLATLVLLVRQSGDKT